MLAAASATAGSSSSTLAAVSGAAPGWGSWTFEPIVLVAIIASCYLYWKTYRNAWTTESRPLGAAWWIPFAAGVTLLTLAGLSPLASIADGWLLSASTLQHVLLADVAPALIILGFRAPLLSLAKVRLPAALQSVLTPWLVIPAWIAITWLWAIPAASDYAASHLLVGMLCHLTLILTGCALWWLIVDPLPSAQLRPNGQRMAFLGITHVASAIVCLPMMWLAHTQYPLFAQAPRAFGISAIDDQHAAGGLMSLIEFLVFGLAFAGVFVSILTRADAGEEAMP